MNCIEMLAYELESRKDETHAYFGEVDLDYTEMYDSLYMVSKPELLSDMVTRLADEKYSELPESEKRGSHQFIFYDILEEYCEELGLPYEHVSVDFMKYDCEVVYLVNYKGEGEGYFIYNDEIKNRIAGEFISKYNYGAL